MQYNSHATSLDCVSEVLAICGATITDYTANEITRRFNLALDRFYTLAFEADGRWNYDDFNETSPPIDEQNLVSGTNRYKFNTFTETILSVLKIEILDSAGKGKSLTPETFDSLHVHTEGYESGQLSGSFEGNFRRLYIDATSGTPSHYIKYGDFIYLRPNPNYNYTDGLIAYFNRPAAYMAATDTTKVPGAPVIFHAYLCRQTALPFLIERKLPQMNAIAQQIQIDEQAIRKHFSRRTKDVVQRMSPEIQDNK